MGWSGEDVFGAGFIGPLVCGLKGNGARVERNSGILPPGFFGRYLEGGVWIAVYIFLAALPLTLLMASSSSNNGERWWEFSVALGFSGMSMMMLQFVLSARFRRATAPFGMDVIYYFHRVAGIGACCLVLGHYAIMRMGYPNVVGTWNPWAQAGI